MELKDVVIVRHQPAGPLIARCPAGRFDRLVIFPWDKKLFKDTGDLSHKDARL